MRTEPTLLVVGTKTKLIFFVLWFVIDQPPDNMIGQN
jgi:hypothetical protein